MLMKWRREMVVLKYDLSDISLFTRQVSGMVCDTHFLDLPMDSAQDVSLGLLRKHMVDVAQVVSCPISRKPQPLTIRNGVILYCTSTYHHHYVNTQVSFDEYLKKFKSKTRSTLKRKVAKLCPDGSENTSFRKYATESEIESFIALAAIVSEKTYQHHLFNRGMPQSKEFIEATRKQAKQGRVRGYLLCHNQKPIAYTFGPMFGNGVFLFDYNGYDPEYSKLSPGNVLQYKTIEDLCSDPVVKTYDLCVGENEHKLLFSSASQYCADFLIFEKTVKNMSLVLSNLAVTLISRFLGNILRFLRLKSWLKKLIRRSSGSEIGAESQDDSSGGV